MEALVRVGTFLGVLTALLLWESFCPRRSLVRPRQERWVTNLSLTLLNTVLVRVTVGGMAYTAAVFAADHGVGLLHWRPLPGWAAAVVTLLVLDFALYLQHVLFHAVPVLWRLHRMHHADLDVDATTGLRFHPLEILLSLGLKAAVVLLLGAVPWAVVAFEVLLNAASVFNHGNVALPERLDRWLRWIVVTPDMHRVHHSTRVVETNANFGFSVSWWDRLCGTYRAQPMLGQVGMDIGLSEYRTPLNLGQLLLLPFRGSAGRYTYAGLRPAHAQEGDALWRSAGVPISSPRHAGP
jgi:sterol desaturase/sphingolipid hydroxylase (fatty acid hydroxylase superfamily)